MQKLISFAILLAISPVLSAQDYIVTLKKDTIEGEVSIPLPKKYVEEVKIETDQGTDIYKIYQVLNVFDDSTFYEPVKHNNKYRLMKVIESGYLTLYQFRADMSYEFNTYYLQKSSLDGIEVPNIGFKKNMVKYLDDCPSVVAKIEDKTYRRDDLKEIVRQYNDCLDSRTEMIYEGKIELETEDEDSKNQKKEKVTDSPALVLIKEIQSKIKTKDNKELNSLLSDIKNKISQKETVPGYLKSALKEQTEGMSEIQNEVNELLKIID